VSATHGSAHLALFDQDMPFIAAARAFSPDLADLDSAENPMLKNNGIPVLQQRGAVFMACHNTIWELAERLVGAEQNPDYSQSRRHRS
jgi:hypothetical protein